MPDSKTHIRLWKQYRLVAFGTAASVGIILYTGGYDMGTATKVAVATVVGYYAGRIIEPDLDLISITTSEAILIKSVLLLPVVAWTTLYARIMQGMGGHRNLWSHMPLISTFIRLCWLTFPLVVLAYFLGWVDALPHFLPHFIGLLVGLGLADTIHAGADFSSSLRRKFITKTRNRRVRGTGD